MKLKYKELKPIKQDFGDWKLFSDKLYNAPYICVVVGARGTGKSVTAFRLAENITRVTGKFCYAMGFPDSSLPTFISNIDELDQVPNNSVVIIDEAGITYSSRNSMSSNNKSLAHILSISRHKNLTLIFVSQHSAKLDIETLRMCDCVLLKPPSLLQYKFERPEVKQIYGKAIKYYGLMTNEEKKQHIYIYDEDYCGLNHVPLPSFWTENISTAYKNFTSLEGDKNG